MARKYRLNRGVNTGFKALMAMCALLAFAVFGSRYAVAEQGGKIASTVNVKVDEVWAGTGLPYEGISVGNIVYLAYFNAERALTVARVDAKSGEVRKKVLNNTFKGWDAHNYVTLIYDKDGFLHVSGNMHASPLIYARTMRPDDFDSLVLVNKMVDSHERVTSYPKFFTFPDGRLGFSYRSGRSGDGIELINKFENHRWMRLLPQPLFAQDPGRERVNAYHTGYTLRPDGYFHVAWVWRKKNGANFNFNVNYARSKDLEHWQDSQGNKIELPITPSRSEVIDAIPVKNGLLNNIKLGFDLKGAPVISYLKYDEDGHSQLYHARLEGDTWRIVQSTDWKYRWTYGDGGTLVKEISFSGVRAEQGRLYEDVSHIKYGSAKWIYDQAKMEKIATQSRAKKTVASSKKKAPESPFKLKAHKIRPMNRHSFLGYIQWKSLGVDNGDLPRTCESIHEKQGCSMTSTLYLKSSLQE